MISGLASALGAAGSVLTSGLASALGTAGSALTSGLVSALGTAGSVLTSGLASALGTAGSALASGFVTSAITGAAIFLSLGNLMISTLVSDLVSALASIPGSGTALPVLARFSAGGAGAASLITGSLILMESASATVFSAVEAMTGASAGAAAVSAVSAGASAPDSAALRWKCKSRLLKAVVVTAASKSRQPKV